MDGAAAAGEEAEEEYASEADVLGELQEREDQLRQAAELGQSLLQRTEDLQLANEQLAEHQRHVRWPYTELEWCTMLFRHPISTYRLSPSSSSPAT